jgi:hypothetical protein
MRRFWLNHEKGRSTTNLLGNIPKPYDTPSVQYIFNWSIKEITAGTYHPSAQDRLGRWYDQDGAHLAHVGVEPHLWGT